jgi:hypothetical protein
MKNNAGDAIKRAEKAGWTVNVRHYRYDNVDFDEMQAAVRLIKKAGGRLTKSVEAEIRENYFYSRASPIDYAPRGGLTVVEITRGEVGFSGEALCSIEDNFNRQQGVKRALRRALRAVKA